MITNLIFVGNGFSILIRDVFSYNPLAIYIWVGVQILINFIFTAELMIDLFSAGNYQIAFSTKFRLWPETLC